MAVTFHQQPTSFSTSDNPLLYVFSSNQTGQANFSYIVQTYINSQLVSTDKVFPRVNGRANWDASAVIKNRIEKPIRPDELITTLTLPLVKVRVTENYGTPPTNQATAITSDIKVIKAKLTEEDWKTTNILTDYVDDKFLTDSPLTVSATKTQDLYLQFPSVSSVSCVIETYNSLGDILDTLTTGATLRDVWSMNLSWQNLDDLVENMADVVWFRVKVGNSDWYNVYYNIAECDNKSVLSWINKFGAFDQFVFTHYQQDKASTEPQSYQKQFGGWVGNVYDYDSEYGEIETVKTTTPSGIIVSGWLTKSVQNWLVSVYSSIGVRLDGKTIKITNSSYELKDGRFEELINEEIQYTKTPTKSIML